MSRYSPKDASEEAFACRVRLLLSDDQRILAAAADDLGTDRQALADKIYNDTIMDGFGQFASGGDGRTPEGRLACVRWLVAWLLAAKHYGGQAMVTPFPGNAAELRQSAL